MTEDVASQTDSTLVTMDAASQTYWTTRSWDGQDVNIVTNLDTLPTCEEEDWSTDEEAYHLGFGREVLLVLEVHPANGGWDTSLTKREC